MYKTQLCIGSAYDSSFAVVIVVTELLDAIISPGDWS